ncbi:nudix hydrolase 20, chloroplastic isoform X2 [Amborella trichopoda]|uniref:nudix hydrolase 20, chloroplastic isoform X2 n=1 Tax=Amborella trichopoda TaxID=13333 RepID=UPI0009C07B06|nr:nudix hydrolase 20, chloroplastic isoform X2 [Amborella trichopoda]|eukprot:XP_020522881.1 nudix hydrolase 20, chloroplastic isoform X2 [Amborella trichopoda]
MAHSTLFNSFFPLTQPWLRSFSLDNGFSLKMGFSLKTSWSRSFSLKTMLKGESFTWDQVLGIAIAEDEAQQLSGLNGYLDKEARSMFMPFILEDEIVGYVHPGFVEHLRKFPNVFTLTKDRGYGDHGADFLTLHPSLVSPTDRTEAVGDAITCLDEGIIPGIRNELYPVTSSYGKPVFFSLERAAAPYFGIKAYGVHMNGYVNKNGEKHLWIGKRSNSKPTYPGMLDHLVAGGLPYGISCKENILKECKEEAGIPITISDTVVPAGAVSYMEIDGLRYKRDVLFCFDLQLPDGFIPANEDGEVESFKLFPVPQVANIIRRTEFFKPNCSLVIIDFLFRHGYISPDEQGYLQLLQGLRSGDCS